MKISKGSTRRVFLFKNIVIKLARIYWYSAFKIMMDSLMDEIKILINKDYRLRCRLIQTEELEEQQINNQCRIDEEKRMEMVKPQIIFYEYYSSVGMCLLSGIMANYQERKFYKKTKNIFVMPTSFSFLGIFNIQKRGEKISFWKDKDIWFYLCSNSKNRNQPLCDSHTLSEIDNFCLYEGHLKIVDYGSRRLEPFLKINGENLFNNFKIPD